MTTVYPAAVKVFPGLIMDRNPPPGRPPDDLEQIPAIILQWPIATLAIIVYALQGLEVRPEEVSVFILHDPSRVERGEGFADLVTKMDIRRGDSRHLIMGEAEFTKEHLNTTFPSWVRRRGYFLVTVGYEENGQVIGLPHLWSAALREIREIPVGSPLPEELGPSQQQN